MARSVHFFSAWTLCDEEERHERYTRCAREAITTITQHAGLMTMMAMITQKKEDYYSFFLIPSINVCVYVCVCVCVKACVHARAHLCVDEYQLNSTTTIRHHRISDSRGSAQMQSISTFVGGRRFGMGRMARLQSEVR